MNSVKRVQYACYTTNLSMSIVGNLPPVLLLTFHELYGISYSLLGLLILINFCTQLSMDLAFSFFSRFFDVPKVVKRSPWFTIAGLLIYSLLPRFSPALAYPGLVIGTVIFSATSGFAEVLISPIIAALPSPDPGKAMSRLHSVYAWGGVFVIVFSTLFLRLFGRANWYWIPVLFALVPLVSALLFHGCTLPQLNAEEKEQHISYWMKNRFFWLSVLAIFLGGASECTMAQWSSSYLEQAFGIHKVWGDILGVAMFAVMLGLGRSLYAKFGRNIEPVLILGAGGAALCYLTAVFSDIPLVGLMACALTGFFTSMLWPGNLIVIGKRFPAGSVVVYAMMAAGGDLGASLVPQMVGSITDRVIRNPAFVPLQQSLGLGAEQLGMKVGMLAAMLFPAAAVLVNLMILKTRKRFETGTGNC